MHRSKWGNNMPEIEWDERFTQDPRKAFINFIIMNMVQIEQRIFFSSRYLSAIEPLQGLISSLDPKSKKVLEQQYKDLEAFEQNTNLCSAAKIKRIYWEVLNYLQDTYLKETRFARPKYEPGKLGIPEDE